jgi:hypothetical protein
MVQRQHPVFVEGCEQLESRQLLSAAAMPVAEAVLAESPALHVELNPAKKSAVATRTAAAAKKTAAAKKMAASGYSGPIIIDQGGVYSGQWQSLSAATPTIRIVTDEPVIIENSVIRGRGTLIEVVANRAKVTIRNNHGYGMNPNVYGRPPGRFIDIDGFSRAIIQNNYLESTAGIYVAGYRGNRTASQTVKILGNYAKNIEGRLSNGRGGWLNTKPDLSFEMQFAQLNGLHGMAKAEIAWNQVINLPGKSRVQDNISIHDSSGKRTSPILVHNNYIQGAYAGGPADARSYVGGGIMVSDNGSSYVRAYSNHVVNTGHIGITITSGHDNRFYNNRIVSEGKTPNGNRLKYSNVGAAIWNFNDEAGFGRNTGYNNLISWIGVGGRNDIWVPPGANWLKNNKKLNVNKNAAAGEWQIWQEKLAGSGRAVGPQ